jgi:hypothetical protein
MITSSSMKIVAAHQRRDGAMRAPQRRRRSSAAMLVINRDRNCVLLTAAYLLKGYQQSDAGRSTRRCSQYARCLAAAHTRRILKRDGTLNARTMEIRAIWRFSFAPIMAERRPDWGSHPLVPCLFDWISPRLPILLLSATK